VTREEDLVPRHLLLHAHMFKNAGSTFDHSLRRSFGDAFTDHRDDDAMRRGAAYLGPYIEEHPGLRALSSHWVTFPLPALPDVVIHPVMLFRDPLERIMSVYRFERRQEGDAPGIRHARQRDFPGYVRWRLQPEVGPVIRNFHTRYCSGNYRGEDLDAMYAKAIETLGDATLLGLVHRYDESMAMFEYHLGHFFPGLDLSGKALNVSDHTPMDHREKRERALAELEPVMNEVVEANRYDLRLYAEVQSRFDAALRAIPDFDDRLREFRQRAGTRH
jgi:hypothetical protein